LGDDKPCKIVGMGTVFHKTAKLKSVAIEEGKACSRSEEKSDFNRVVGR